MLISPIKAKSKQMFGHFLIIDSTVERWNIC